MLPIDPSRAWACSLEVNKASVAAVTAALAHYDENDYDENLAVILDSE